MNAYANTVYVTKSLYKEYTPKCVWNQSFKELTYTDKLE